MLNNKLAQSSSGQFTFFIQFVVSHINEKEIFSNTVLNQSRKHELKFKGKSKTDMIQNMSIYHLPPVYVR